MLDTLNLESRDTSRTPDSEHRLDSEYEEVLTGLQAKTPHVSPKWFYDDVGSALFEAITRVPEYYPTRCEIEILDTHGAEIGRHVAKGMNVVELGSGSAQKVGRLLAQLRAPRNFRPIDVSAAALDATVTELASRFPKLPVHPVEGDFCDPAILQRVFRDALFDGDVLLFFPGSTLGNFTPREAEKLLTTCGANLPTGTPFVLGVDLVKPPTVLEAAYDDAAGVTAAFNRNMLAHLNRHFDANFDVRRWVHQARWNPKLRRIEMWLRSHGQQRVRFGDATLTFSDGAGIHTENSHKWDRASLGALAGKSGWRIDGWWTDAKGWFAEVLLSRTNEFHGRRSA